MSGEPIPNTDTSDGRGTAVGEMHMRRETMADGRRYIIYYTFGDESEGVGDGEDEVNVRA